MLKDQLLLGEQWTYSNWAKGQPDNYGGNEHQVALQWNRATNSDDFRSRWEFDDNDGSQQCRFICESTSSKVNKKSS